MKNVSQNSSVPRSSSGRNRCRTGEVVTRCPPTAKLALRRSSCGAIFCSVATMRSRDLPVITRWRTDSGSIQTSATASSSGSTPPATSTERQPKASISPAEARPPKAEPSVKPQNMVVTRKERRLSGQNSEVSVIALGMAPPRPSPVRKRSSTSVHRSFDQAEARLAAPKNSTDSTSTPLRPKRSASGPNRKAPAIRPPSPAPNSGASCAGVNCHSARMAGAIKPIAAVSKPSTATIRKHSTTMVTWNADSGWRSMNAVTSSGWLAGMVSPP
ncbi:hypothetical protein Tamer19_19740 [Cupriavidus sp. TA19]|nr:hypothetical protein Tamer19_19740 [Cupriavidus sp. TA19]